MEAPVLVGVLRSPRDLELLRRQRWYRIPAAACPVRRFDYLAFYQPAAFGREGRRIRYYARIRRVRHASRRDLLPDEPGHPRAARKYCRFDVGPLRRLGRPVRNTAPRRVTFGFTTLRRLRTARDLLALFAIPPIEGLMARALKRARLGAARERTVVLPGGRRCRPDFTVFCRRGPLAVECDGLKWHGSRRQAKRDAARDRALRRRGWTVLRFSEPEIVADPDGCARRVSRAAGRLGGAGVG